MEPKIIREAQYNGASFKTEQDKERYVKEQNRDVITTILFMLLMLLIVAFAAFLAGQQSAQSHELAMAFAKNIGTALP